MNYKVPIEISARHIHLCKNDADQLFGPDYQFNKHVDLSQPGQFACKEKIDISSLKDTIIDIRIIFPLRDKTQLEISTTDAIKLGVKPPVRVSGDLSGSTGRIKLHGPKGVIELSEGVIIAKRHLHIEPDLAKINNLNDGQVISIETNGTRPITFHDVIVRSRPNIDKLSFMLDTDEANAAGLSSGDFGNIRFIS